MAAVTFSAVSLRVLLVVDISKEMYMIIA